VTTLVGITSIIYIENLLAERWKLRTLAQYTADTSMTITFLATRGLLKNSVMCPTCNIPCSLVAYEKGIDKERWRRTKCKCSTQSIRKDSFFSKKSSGFKDNCGFTVPLVPPLSSVFGC
jgi:hypothetical protein